MADGNIACLLEHLSSKLYNHGLFEIEMCSMENAAIVNYDKHTQPYRLISHHFK